MGRPRLRTTIPVLRSLLVCRDPDTLRVFRRASGDLEIEVEVATAASSALESLDSNKFDAIIVDCDDVAGGTDVLTGIQQSRSNKRAIAIAVINGTTNMRAAFEMGARFALDKPVTVERAVRALRAAHSFMVTEQRRYFRCAVDTEAYLSFGVVKQLPCTVTNVSDGGMAITLREPTSLSWAVDVRFHLPGIREALEVKVSLRGRTTRAMPASASHTSQLTARDGWASGCPSRSRKPTPAAHPARLMAADRSRSELSSEHSCLLTPERPSFDHTAAEVQR